MPNVPTVADRLRRVLPDLPAAERRVARVLLANYPVAGLETIARVAARSGASGPTVLRLATRLGLGGYGELQQLLRDELEARARSPLTAYEAAPRADGGDDGDDAPARAAEVFGPAVTGSLRGLERADFDQAVELLRDPGNRVLTTGGRFSGVLAEYLALHLQELRPAVTPVRMGDRVPALLDLGRRDVVVVFDFRRYQPDVVTFGRAAARRRARVVLVSDPWTSPLAAVATVVLTADVTAPSPFDSLVPAMAVVETLVAGVVAALGDGPRDRIARYDELWADQFRPLEP